MARVAVQDAVEKIGNRFDLVLSQHVVRVSYKLALKIL